MAYVDEYNRRGYVKAVRRGALLFFVGLPFGLYMIGNLIGLIGGIMHHFDSNRRIAALEGRPGRIQPGRSRR